jgi:hypothetical protein
MNNLIKTSAVDDWEDEQRQLAALRAWLHDEELAEGELESTLPWLPTLLWETFGGTADRLGTEVWQRYSEQAWRRVGNPEGACYRNRMKSTLGLAEEEADDPYSLPAGHLWGLTNNLEAVVIDCPFDAAVVELHWEDEKQVERALLEVTRETGDGRFVARRQLLDLFPRLTSRRLAEADLYLWSISIRPDVLVRVNAAQLTHLVQQSPDNGRLRDLAARKAALESASNPEDLR